MRHALGDSQISFALNIIDSFVCTLGSKSECRLLYLRSSGQVDLAVRICQEVGGARNLLISSLVDILLQWTMPRMNKRLEVQQAKVALDLIKKTLSPTNFSFVKHCYYYEILA